jgi:hypothetical protein
VTLCRIAPFFYGAWEGRGELSAIAARKIF